MCLPNLIALKIIAVPWQPLKLGRQAPPIVGNTENVLPPSQVLLWSIGGRPAPRRRLFQCQWPEKPSRCQRTTASRCNARNIARHPSTYFANSTQTKRSAVDTRGRVTECLNIASCRHTSELFGSCHRAQWTAPSPDFAPVQQPLPQLQNASVVKGPSESRAVEPPGFGKTTGFPYVSGLFTNYRYTRMSA